MNKTEIDHIGAYLCGHKLSELLNMHYNGLKVLFEGRKTHLKNLEQWRLFCFVFVFVFKQVNHDKRRQMTTETTIGQTTIGADLIVRRATKFRWAMAADVAEVSMTAQEATFEGTFKLFRVFRKVDDEMLDM